VFCVHACLFYVWFVCVLFVPSVLWYSWLGLLTCKNRLPYNLYCVGGDVKHCSLTRSEREVFVCLSAISAYMLYNGFIVSDVKRGQNLEADARATRPRPKIIMKKFQIMINNIWFKIIAGKINKIPEFYTIFARKMPDCIIRQRDRGQAEAKNSRLRRKLRGQGRGWGQNFGLEAPLALRT